MRAGQSKWFTVNDAALANASIEVATVTRQRYPTLNIPNHSRWRHFEPGGVDRKALLDAGTAGEDAAPATLENLSAAAADLEAVNRQALDMRPAAAAVTTLAAVPAGPAPVAPPAETLALGERYTYDDSSGENMVSLLVESTRTVATYEAVPTNGSTTQVEAGDGRTFLLVVVDRSLAITCSPSVYECYTVVEIFATDVVIDVDALVE